VSALIVCGTCDGRRKDCDDCGGLGKVPDTTAADALARALSDAGVTQSYMFLDAVLDECREELVAWLLEAGVLRASEFMQWQFAQDPERPYRTPSGHKSGRHDLIWGWHAGRLKDITDRTDKRARLYTIEVGR